MRKVAFIRGNRLAIAAVENALWDLQVKLQGRSLKSLIGGIRSEVRVGVSLGIEADIPTLLAADRDLSGGGLSPDQGEDQAGWDIEVLREIRRHYPSIVLTVDANSDYGLEDIELFKAMDDLDLAYIEQPLAEDDIVDHAVLQKAIRTPICLDESIVSVEAARKAIGLGSCRIINIKSSRCGGIHEAIRIHDLCRESGIPVLVRRHDRARHRAGAEHFAGQPAELHYGQRHRRQPALFRR